MLDLVAKKLFLTKGKGVHEKYARIIAIDPEQGSELAERIIGSKTIQDNYEKLAAILNSTGFIGLAAGLSRDECLELIYDNADLNKLSVEDFNIRAFAEATISMKRKAREWAI